ncbi:hypothetical protein D021_1703B, partial [Vibrio parahaemolyticus 10296]
PVKLSYKLPHADLPSTLIAAKSFSSSILKRVSASFLDSIIEKA